MPSQMMGALQEVQVWTSGLDLEQGEKLPSDSRRGRRAEQQFCSPLLAPASSLYQFCVIKGIKTAFNSKDSVEILQQKNEGLARIVSGSVCSKADEKQGWLKILL